MKDLIDRHDAYKVLTEYYNHHTEAQHQSLKEALNRVPEAVERCKDCKNYVPYLTGDGCFCFSYEENRMTFAVGEGKKMKFIIAIKDKFGNTLSQYEQNAEPQYIAMWDAYEFMFSKFHMLIDRNSLEEIKRKYGDDGTND